jgi:hypothetical protein
MNTSTQRLWKWSLRCYRILLRVYPSEFRKEFGEQLDQLFRDISRDESRRGLWGLAILWARVVPDLAYSAIASRQSYDLGWRFRFRWIVACALGFSLFPFADDALRYVTGFPFYFGEVRIYIPWPPREIFAAVSGLTIALFQSLVVSNEWLERKRWLFFSVGSEVVVSILSRTFPRDPSMSVIVGLTALCGALTGFAQSLALRGRPPQMVLWVTSSSVGAVTVVLMYYGMQPIFTTLIDSGFFLVASFTMQRTVAQAITGLTVGVLTAVPLEWILRTRPRPLYEG